VTVSPYSDSLSLGLRIDFLNPATPYKSPAHSSTGTRSDSIILPLLVSERFHVLFHSPTGVLFTFPSRYYFAIGHLGVFSLTRWSSLIHTGFHVPHATRDLTYFKLLTTGLSPSLVQDSAASSNTFLHLICLPTTPIRRIGLGCSRFARRYYGNRVCFLFLQLLRCFNSLGCLFLHYEFMKKFLRLSYSGIFGSKLVASSPKRFAGICALHRL
jgi:hypothetical protein